MKRLNYTIISLVFLLVACNKSKLEEVTILPSSGSALVLNGLVGGEDGAAAGNSVFVDFSMDEQATLLRAGWDLGFYCGQLNRVIINNTTAAMAVLTNKSNLEDVTSADAAGLTFEVEIANPSPETFLKLDAIDGDLTKTVIPEINTTLSPVVIIGRGVGGATPRRVLIKAQFKMNQDGSYLVRWADIDSNNFQSETIAKDDRYHFKYLSFDSGTLEKATPEKKDWDIMWGNSVYQTPNGNQMAAYVFSDIVMLNYLSGVQAIEKVYSTTAEATAQFATYSAQDAQQEVFLSNRWSIGANWRATPAPGVQHAGVKKDRFYVVKDAEGYYYKLQFLSFSESDGGTRGAPKLEYERLQ